MTSGVTFPSRDGAAFSAEVKREVDAYFAERKLSRKASVAMVIKTLMILGLTIGSYLGILLLDWPPLAKLGLAVVMGIGVAGVGFAIVHDALHGAYSSKPWINGALGRLFDIFGANAYLWKITHNVIHHTYTNIEGIDEDLTVSPLLRLSPSSPLRAVHRWQHLYGFFAYAGSTLFWVFSKDFKYILQRDLGPYRDIKHPPTEIVNLLITKVFYYAWSLVVPLLVLDIPWWQVLIGYLVMHITAGLILGVVFQLAHVVEGPEYPAPDGDGRMANGWLIHEMLTTANFAPNNPVVGWYVGGLNYQIEHHLFPKVCSVHYPAIAPIVREVAQRHGIPYYSHPTLMAAIRSHHKMLRTLGPVAWSRRVAQEARAVA